jgi:hypothetical protein
MTNRQPTLWRKRHRSGSAVLFVPASCTVPLNYGWSVTCVAVREGEIRVLALDSP